MTAPEIRPATDDQVRAWHDLAATGLMIVPTTIVDSLVARIEADRAERESNNRAFAEMNAVFSAVMRAVRGEALSEFDESHGAVHEANALRAAAQERDRKIAELEQERDDDTALIRRLNATVAARAEEIERLKKESDARLAAFYSLWDLSDRAVGGDITETYFIDERREIIGRLEALAKNRHVRAALKPESTGR